ncbi:TonB family protein [Bryobacter aggregatus]|uniref:TonB family protein n=1 Tax=Bryobacter aggregatus TaxID=360054 RepID=UPI0004E21118|nr:TonB family protein [Bryobacter aggregatus]
MPAILPSDPTNSPVEELNLIRDWDEASLRPKRSIAAILSVVFHLVFFGLILMAPRSLFDSHYVPPQDAPRVERKVIPLVAPRFELTQKEKNKGPIKQELNVDDLNASLQNRRAPKTYIPPPTPTPRSEPQQQPVEAPPQLQPIAPDTRQLAQLGTPQLPPPEIRPQEQLKKSPFENVGQAAGAKKGLADGRIPQMQRQSMEDMARQSAGASQGTSGQVVTDLPSPANPMRPQNQIGSSLELLSDPQGVDFRPYLKRILAIVRKNWFAVIPESANYGRRGKTMIQFSISRDGRVPKLVISGPSGTEALDRAAVAGISASNPFPPLPAEFKGDVVRLQFAFSYNMP